MPRAPQTRWHEFHHFSTRWVTKPKVLGTVPPFLSACKIFSRLIDWVPRRLQAPGSRQVPGAGWMSTSSAWVQRIVTVNVGKGKDQCYLATSDLLRKLPELKTVKNGMLSVFRHGLDGSVSVNENADYTVRTDMQAAMLRLGAASKLKAGADRVAFQSALFGQSLTLPVSNGRVCFGTWQGMYLCSWDGTGVHRVVLTLYKCGLAGAKTTHLAVKPTKRGVHSIDDQVPKLAGGGGGVVNAMIRHTSASMGIADAGAGMRGKLFNQFNASVPERWNEEFFVHTYEGPDDMPGHVKSSLFGVSILLPIPPAAKSSNHPSGQGLPANLSVVVNEHRDVGWGHSRKLCGVFAPAGAVRANARVAAPDGKSASPKGPCGQVATEVILAAISGELKKCACGWVSVLCVSPATGIAIAPDAGRAEQLSKGFAEFAGGDAGVGLGFAPKCLTIPVRGGKMCLSDNENLVVLFAQRGNSKTSKGSAPAWECLVTLMGADMSA